MMRSTKLRGACTAAHEWTVNRMTEYDGDKTVSVRLTKSQCKNVAEFIEFSLIDCIRNDQNIDNICWVSDMADAYKALEKAGGKG